jgi:hypothetical protein
VVTGQKKADAVLKNLDRYSLAPLISRWPRTEIGTFFEVVGLLKSKVSS